jgi:hypothetical protein
MERKQSDVDFAVPEDWDKKLADLYKKYLDLSEGFFTDPAAEADIADDPEDWNEKADAGWWK